MLLMGHPPLVLAPSALVGSCKTGPTWTLGFHPSVALAEMLCGGQ